MAVLPVHHWPNGLAPLSTSDELIVIAVNTPQTSIRGSARRLLRQAVAEVLTKRGITDHLIAIPGQAPHLEKDRQIGLSFTHEPGLSLAAIHFNGPVGIDLIKLGGETPEAPEIRQLARDYLGPELAEQIGGDWPAFAEAWTAHEARLKCLGMALSEWTPALEQGFVQCRRLRLALPAGHVGALCTKAF